MIDAPLAYVMSFPCRLEERIESDERCCDGGAESEFEPLSHDVNCVSLVVVGVCVSLVRFYSLSDARGLLSEVLCVTCVDASFVPCLCSTLCDSSIGRFDGCIGVGCPSCADHSHHAASRRTRSRGRYRGKSCECWLCASAASAWPRVP